jgi:GTP-binding protein
MDVRRIELATQAFRPDQVPAVRGPEVVFAGRSNVGKSSLINKLIGRQNLARVSSTPGKTRAAFFYSVNDGKLILVDLPGFGYAKGAREQRVDWEAIGEILFRREGPRLAVQLVDLRLPAQAIDLEAAAWLDGLDADRMVVGTKLDKLAKNDRAKSVRLLTDAFGQLVFPTSAETGEGIRDLWKEIDLRLGLSPRA